ncbi:dermonecrotic toxin domain-containing protein [Pseudomonas sp. Z2-11]
MPTLAYRSFIRSRLPAWLLEARPAEQAKMREAALSLATTGYRLNDAIKTIPSIRDFALPRLQPAMDRLFGASIDLESSFLVRPNERKRHSLFDWALYNFTRADTQATAFARGSHFELRPDSGWASRTKPGEFARLCRELDIGAAYQTELQGQMPAWPSKTVDVPRLAIKYLDYYQALLQHDAQRARMQGLLDTEGERILAYVRIQLDAARPVEALTTVYISGLELKHTEGANRPAVLRGVRVFWARHPGTAVETIPLVVHIPGDPVAPLKQYSSSLDFSKDLFARLTRTDDAAFLRSLMPLRDRGWFDKAVQHRAKDEQWDFNAGGVPDGYYHGLYQNWRSSVMTRASEVARPVALIERNALPKNADWWLNLEIEVIALVLICVAGAEVVESAAAVLGIGQLVQDVYEGIQHLSEGHLRQAIGHLFDAALDAGMEAAGDVAANSLVSEMFPVPLVNDSLRLWHGLTTGFIAKRSPPAGLAPDEFGVWRAAGRAWIKVGEHFYEVVGYERSLRLKLPANYRGMEPALEWSRARGWRWAYQSPLCMTGFRLLREVVPGFRLLPDISLQRAQWSTGITDEQLRYAALNDTPLPGQLLYMARRFEAREQLLEAEVRLRAGEALPSVPRGMVQMLTELPGWPAQRAFRYSGEAGTSFASPGTGAELLLDVADFRAGRWQQRLLAQLGSTEMRALLGEGASAQEPTIVHQRLADRLADRLKTNGYPLIDAFADLDAFTALETRPGSALMHRLFPSLPGPMLDSLLASVTGEELQGLLAGRVSNSLARRTVEALRELRICRALEFMLASEASNDRDRLVMALLGPELHNMDGEVQVQLILDKGFIGGPLRVGKRGPLKTIRRSGAHYQLFDETGKALTALTNLEIALSRILFDNQPNPMELANKRQGDLRARLFERALNSRASLRLHLGMLALTPPKLRLLGGYPMIDRSALVSARRTLDERLWSLYPDQDISAAVKAELQARSISSGRAIELLVSDKEIEWSRLDLSLRNWETAAGKHHEIEHDNPAVRLEARQHFGKELRKCWRRERTSTLVEEGEVREVFSLAVEGDTVGVLPSIDADFSHVELLILRDMGLTPDPSHFLHLFPRVAALWLSENRLTRCPPAIAQMPRLRLLHLGRNPIVFDDQTFTPLLAAGAGSELQHMDLSGIDTSMDAEGPGGVSAIEALGRLPRLEELVWLDNDGFAPAQLQAIGRLIRLQLLDLTNCRLRLDAQSAAFVAQLANLRRLNLGGNIISELPDLTGLSQLTDLDLSLARIESVPLAVIALLRRDPLGLLAVDLSGNRITSVEALLPTLARPLGEGERMVVALDDNPLPAEQIERLRGTGQSFAYSRDIWMGNETVQRRFEALRQNPADGRFLDWLSDAVKQSEGYDFGPDLDSGRDRALAIAGRFFQLDAETAQLAGLVPDFDERFDAFRKRICQRLQHLPLSILDEAMPPILDELETHLAIFLSWCRAMAQPQQPPFASFIHDLFGAWQQYLSDVQRWDDVRIANDATRERFVQRLLETQGAFSTWENPQYGDLYWFPYLREMSARWADFQTQWDELGETLTEASSTPVDTSNWPQVLRDYLLAPPQALPGPALEAASDVVWGNAAVQLNEDQYRRAWAIFRAVKASEAERVAMQATEELVGPWWVGRGVP